MAVYSTNLGLAALPEIPQDKYPEIYAEMVRIRNALSVLQGAIDGVTGYGGQVVSHSVGILAPSALVVGNNNGDVRTLSSFGTLGQVLQSTGPGTDPTWGSALAGPVMRAHASATTIFPAGNTAYKLTFNVVDVDSASSFASSRYTPTQAGWYSVTGSFGSSISANDYVLAQIQKNGSVYSYGAYATRSAIGYSSDVATVTDLVYCNGTTDYIEIWGSASIGLTTTGASTTDYFSAHFIHT